MEKKKIGQIITIVVCLIIAVVATVFSHMNLGEVKSFGEIFGG